MPIEIGGLGFPPQTIGLVLSLYGVITGFFQVFFFAKLIRRLGERRLFLMSMSTNLVIFALFPIMSAIAKRYGFVPIIWVLIGVLLLLAAAMDPAFGAIFMFVTASAPKSSRGSANGLSQTTVSLARAIGPALATSLFSFSVKANLLNGNAVYVVFFILSVLALVLGTYLPHEVWEEKE